MLTAKRLARPPDPLRGSVLTSPHPLTPSSLPTPPRRISLLHAVPAPESGWGVPPGAYPEPQTSTIGIKHGDLELPDLLPPWTKISLEEDWDP